ncbi:sodium-dependent transporter [Schaalia sp. 19OD2882]|uniref:sodium-dependent transporter n=1 Tax=Schaalia sp. 19OD2882 TaxID=2794089 RepID=UPI001C1E948E|nr:sodium-dependent transporter [Schaalia sp. 19OD2882]QWW20421.1 sodium-dependent transporter [Schaalia sp. 19OD2882]
MSESAAPTSGAKTRDTWTGQTGFLLAAIGSAIGLGNIWRFPGVAYTNGGGAFLIPYLVALVAIGIPVLWLDYAIGHKFRGSPPWALRRIGAVGEFFGWVQVFVCFVIFAYYAAVIAWAAQYVVFSVTEAWGNDPMTFFVGDFLKVADTDAVHFDFVPAVAIPLALVWLVVLLIMGLGVSRGVEVANRIFLPLLVVLFLALVVRALFLPGAVEGLNAFFTPDWSALTNYHVWLAAISQIFFSLSVAFGIMLTYASYLKPRSNLTGTGLVAGFANSSFEILAGLGVFSALGFMAHEQGVTFSQLEGLTGPILSFVTFPKIISMMPGGPLFGVLFFTSLVLAGITSLLSLLQVVSGGLQDKFGMSPVAASFTMGIPATVISIVLYGTTSGLNTLDIVDAFINNVGIVGSAIATTVYAAILGPKMKGLRAHLNSVSSVKVPRAWDHLVGIVVPIVLGVMLFMALVDYVTKGYGENPAWYVGVFGWGSIVFVGLASLVLTFVPWRHRPITLHISDLTAVSDTEEATR